MNKIDPAALLASFGAIIPDAHFHCWLCCRMMQNNVWATRVIVSKRLTSATVYKCMPLHRQTTWSMSLMAVTKQWCINKSVALQRCWYKNGQLAWERNWHNRYVEAFHPNGAPCEGYTLSRHFASLRSGPLFLLL